MLTEVSFHGNGMRNDTSSTSPHMLVYGRYTPRGRGEFIQRILEQPLKQAGISEFVLEKINRNLKRIKERNLSSIQVGARVMPKRNMLQGSLDPCFDRP